MHEARDAGDATTGDDDAGSSDPGTSGQAQPDITVAAPRYTLEPGQELSNEYCQPLDNSEPLLFRGFEVRSGHGLHHTQAHVVSDSSSSSQERWLLGTSTGVSNTAWFLPPKTVFAIPPNAKLCFDTHAVNTTSDPIQIVVELGLYLAEPAPDLRRATMMFAQTEQIDLPPATAKTVSFDCEAAQDMTLIAVTPHTHTLGTNLRVSRDGTLVTEWDTLWDAPWRDLTLKLAAGDRLHVECDYANTTSNTVVYGTTTDKEMCMLAGFYVPGAGTQADVDQSLGCTFVAP
jgi:hypothetical protein